MTGRFLSSRHNPLIEMASIESIDPAPMTIAAVSASFPATPIVPSTTIALISRTPHPAKLTGTLAANMTTAEAAASPAIAVCGESACAAAT